MLESLYTPLFQWPLLLKVYVSLIDYHMCYMINEELLIRHDENYFIVFNNGVASFISLLIFSIISTTGCVRRVNLLRLLQIQICPLEIDLILMGKSK